MMDGNPHYWAAQDPQADSGAQTLTQAMLAVAFELRTRNMLDAQVTPDWLNEARSRMGAERFPPVKDFTTPLPAGPVDRRCEKQLMDGRNEIRCWLKANHPGDCK